MEPSGITFIYSNVDFDDAHLPFVISDALTLRTATSSEVLELNKHLEKTYGTAARFVVPFDHELVEVEKDGAKKTIYSKSDKSRWWVVAFNGCNQEIFKLSKISTLLS